MALTSENIIQMAVANLGQTEVVTSISAPSSKAEKLGALYYDTVLTRLLAKHNWSWATRRAVLTDVTATELKLGWSYAYTFPADMVRFIDIDLGYRSGPDVPGLDPVNPTLPGASWVIEMNAAGTGKILLCDIQNASGVYVAKITNLTLWDPDAIDALTWQCSKVLAAPLTAKPEFVAQARDIAESVLNRAIADDANEAHPDHIYTSEIITSRLVGSIAETGSF